MLSSLRVFVRNTVCIKLIEIASVHYSGQPGASPKATCELLTFDLQGTYSERHPSSSSPTRCLSSIHTSMSSVSIIRLAARSQPSILRTQQPAASRLPILKAKGSTVPCCQFSTTPYRASGGAGDEEESFEQFTARYGFGSCAQLRQRFLRSIGIRMSSPNAPETIG